MDPINFQVTADAADPHSLARFWAQAIGYQVEDHHEFILRMIDEGHATRDDVIEIDGRLFWAIGSAISHPDGKRAGRVLFLRVPEPKTVKNRWHLDLNVGRDRIDEQVARLAALGAKELYRIDEPAGVHTTMADPEGNEFCVQ